MFFPRAIELCKDEFNTPTEAIPFETWPTGRESQALEVDDTEIQFLVNSEEWQTHREKLTALVQAVYQAWEDHNSNE